MKVKSKYKAWVFLPVFLLILVSGLLCLIICKIVSKENVSIENLPSVVYVVVGLLLFILTWLLFGELRKRSISVAINNSSITRKNFIGFGSPKVFDLNEFEGFVTMLVPSTWEDYEYLYLLRQNHKAIILSEFYHKNYQELKREISNKVTFLGNKPFTLMEVIKNIY